VTQARGSWTRGCRAHEHRKPGQNQDAWTAGKGCLPLSPRPPQGCGRTRPAPSGAPLTRSVRSSPARGLGERDFNNGSEAMGVGSGTGRVPRGVDGGLVMAVLLWLAHAAPGLASNHDRPAVAPRPGCPAMSEASQDTLPTQPSSRPTRPGVGTCRAAKRQSVRDPGCGRHCNNGRDLRRQQRRRPDRWRVRP